MRFSKVANRSPRRRSLCRNNFTLLRKHRFEAKVLANQGRDILLRDAKDPKNAKRPANAANASPRPCDYDYITSHFYALLFPTSWSRDEEDVSTCWVFIDRSFFFLLSLSLFSFKQEERNEKKAFSFFFIPRRREEIGKKRCQWSPEIRERLTTATVIINEREKKKILYVIKIAVELLRWNPFKKRSIMHAVQRGKNKTTSTRITKR